VSFFGRPKRGAQKAPAHAYTLILFARLRRPRRQRAVDRLRLQPGYRGRGEASECANEGRGATDRCEHRAIAGAARECGLGLTWFCRGLRK
jgi:hypothetical protein